MVEDWPDNLLEENWAECVDVNCTSCPTAATTWTKNWLVVYWFFIAVKASLCLVFLFLITAELQAGVVFQLWPWVWIWNLTKTDKVRCLLTLAVSLSGYFGSATCLVCPATVMASKFATLDKWVNFAAFASFHPQLGPYLRAPTLGLVGLINAVSLVSYVMAPIMVDSDNSSTDNLDAYLFLPKWHQFSLCGNFVREFFGYPPSAKCPEWFLFTAAATFLMLHGCKLQSRNSFPIV